MYDIFKAKRPKNMQYLCLEPTPMSYTQTQVVRLTLVFDQEENI